MSAFARYKMYAHILNTGMSHPWTINSFSPPAKSYMKLPSSQNGGGGSGGRHITYKHHHFGQVRLTVWQPHAETQLSICGTNNKTHTTALENTQISVWRVIWRDFAPATPSAVTYQCICRATVAWRPRTQQLIALSPPSSAIPLFFRLLIHPPIPPFLPIF